MCGRGRLAREAFNVISFEERLFKNKGDFFN